MTTVLITGGAGFIGHHLAKAWLKRGATVRVLDNLRTGFAKNLAGLDVELILGTTENAETVEKAVQGVDYIHHFAAVVSVPESVQHPHLTESVNITGTLNLLAAAKRQAVRKIVFASSSAVYGTIERPEHRETDLPAPLSPYAITKLAGEYYMSMAQMLHGIPTVSLRYFNVFGPNQDPASPYAAAIARFTACAAKGEPLTIFGTGEQTRDFIHVQDVVAANLLAAELGEGVYNVSRNEKITVNELARLIVKATGGRSEIVHLPVRAGDVLHSRGNSDRLMALGWKPAVELEAGIAELLA